MQSKTPFFNTTLLRKNITRFWPLWAAYLAIWLLMMTAGIAASIFGPVSATAPATPVSVARTVYDMTGIFSIVMAGAFSCFCAMAVLSYLYTARSAGFMHSLPIKRGGLFLTSYVSGYLFMLVPNAAVLGLTAAVAAAGGCPAGAALLTWFMMINGMELFFYSFAILCGMMTGQVLMLPVLYAILNVLSAGMYAIFTGICDTFLYGFSNTGVGIWALFSPAVKMARTIGTNISWDDSYVNMASCSISGAGVVAAYAGVGAAIAVAAYIFARVRRSETAGDAISFGWAKVAFKFGVGFCAAFTLGQLLYDVIVDQLAGASASLPGMLACTIFAGAIGYYAAQMLMEKSFRVFSHGRVCAAVLAAAVIFVCCAFAFDVAGYEKNVPAASDVSEVSVSVSAWNWTQGTVEDGDNVLLVTEIHQSMLDQRSEQSSAANSYSSGPASDDEYCGSLTIDYRLKNGKTMSRSYSVLLKRQDESDVSTITGMLSELVNTKEFLVSTTMQGLRGGDIRNAYIQYTDEAGNWQELNLTKSETAAVYSAITADIDAGNMPRTELFKSSSGSGSDENAAEQGSGTPSGYGGRSVAFEANNKYVSIDISEGMTNLIGTMQSLGILARIDN